LSLQKQKLALYGMEHFSPIQTNHLKMLKNTNDRRIKKSTLIEKLEEKGIVDDNLSIAAKHSKLKGLLNVIVR
jgi:hypothetical protein